MRRLVDYYKAGLVLIGFLFVVAPLWTAADRVRRWLP